MRKALRHIKGAEIVFIQLDGNMLKVSWTFRAQVNDDIEDRAACAADEFRLGCGRILKVHTTQGPFPEVESDIGLRDNRFQSARLELFLAEGTRKKTSGVFSAFQINNICSSELRFRDYHSKGL